MDTFVGKKENSMEIPRWLHEVLFGKRFRILKHILFWVYIYLDELLSFVGLTESFGSPIWYDLIDLAADMLMVYINLYVLIPRLFLKGKIISYVLLTLLSILLVILFNYWCWYSGNDLRTHIFSNLWSTSGIVGLAVAFKLFQESYLSSKKMQALKEDKLKTELAYLKTQVNPHFLFNTLNNMYVMAKKNSDTLPDTIMQLSDLLRYQLYDTEADLVPLNNEIQYLKNYLELELLRRQHLKLEFEITGNTGSQKIRPLILLPYIENAFKYSNSGTGSDYIKIQLHASEEAIDFSVENNKGTLHRRAVGGIGMTNAQRRLELGYPDNHTLDIKETDKTFIVTLNLQSQ